MKILIIDNHTLFRDGLRFLLQQSTKGFDVVLEANNFRSGLHLAEQNPDIDVILMEINSPGCGGLTSIEQLYKRYPDIPLVVVSSEECGQVIKDALNNGARGFVCKSSTGSILLSALRYVIDGGIFIPPQLIKHTGNIFNIDSSDESKSTSSTTCRLTPRQAQVLTYIQEGLSNKEIASATRLAEGTVKIHVASVFQTLRVNNRAQAKTAAYQLGLSNWQPAPRFA